MYVAIMKVLLMEWKGWYNDTVRIVGRNEGGGLEREFNPHFPKLKKKNSSKSMLSGDMKTNPKGITWTNHCFTGRGLQWESALCQNNIHGSLHGSPWRL